MPNPLNALDFAAFTVGGTDMLALLKAFQVSAANEVVDARGLADRYAIYQPVKQSQLFEFTAFQPRSGGTPASGLDITLWDIAATAYLGTVRKGSIAVTTGSQDRSGIADAYRFPCATRTDVEVTTDKLVVSTAPLLSNLLTGDLASFAVTVSITFGGVSFSCPMMLQSASHEVRRGELQMEHVRLVLAGTPTGPTDSSLLGNALLGTALVSVSANSGGGIYTTATGHAALIERLVTTFADGSLIEQVGRFAVQGEMTWTA